MNLDKKRCLIEAIQASLHAGKEIMKVYQTEHIELEIKADETPLTLADKNAHQAILANLEALHVPILSEEGEHLPYAKRKKWHYCWIVDPLDGTKEFINRNDEFTVNIALIENGKPIMGVIYIPVFKQLYFAEIEIGAYRMDHIVELDSNLSLLIQKAQKLPETNKRENFVVVGSKSHLNKATQQFVDKLKAEKPKLEFLSKGSSLKFCMIAENKADVYPRFAPTMEWDTAAGHAIATATGAQLLDTNSKQELVYNKENLLNPFFICKNR